MRDHEKYCYVEVALRRNHPAIQNLIAEAERRDIPLSTMVKEACIVYGEGSERPRVSPSKPAKEKDADTGISVLDQSISSANDFLDQSGF